MSPVQEHQDKVSGREDETSVFLCFVFDVPSENEALVVEFGRSCRHEDVKLVGKLPREGTFETG